MVLKSNRESALGYASVPSTLCRFSIVPTLPLSAAFHESGRRPDPTRGCRLEQGGGITNSASPQRLGGAMGRKNNSAHSVPCSRAELMVVPRCSTQAPFEL